jgi:tryptophanyl-tRNA synthetase
VIESRPVVLSGIQPSGQLHLGNYIGAISFWVEKQSQHRNYLFIADLHAATVPEQLATRSLRESSHEAAGLYLACGIDPGESLIFLQSDVPQHPYLGWLIQCLSPMGWLDRMTQFKSKAEGRDVIGAGLYAYPALQAADILLYDADYVPVGEDQRQHVEFTRDVAQRFNAMFGECLKIPAPLMRTSGARIMGLDNPAEKMSKSAAASRPGHAIQLLDDADTIRRKFRAAKTDSGGPVSFEHSSAGVVNMLTTMEVLTGQSRRRLEEHFAGRGYKALKDEVADAVISRLQPIQRGFARIMSDRGYLDGVLRQGRDRAIAIASKTLARVRNAMGM